MKHLIAVLAVACTFAVVSHVSAQAVQPAPSAPAAPASPIPFKKEEASTGAMAGKTFVVAALLLAVAFGGLLIARRLVPHWQGQLAGGFKSGGTSRRLKLLESTRLGPRTTLYLIQADDRVLLLAQSGDSIVQVNHEGVPQAGAETGKA